METLKEPRRLSWQEIAITMLAATLASVFCATVFYSQICAASMWLESRYIPLEPCVINAIVSAVVGCCGYFIATKANYTSSTSDYGSSGLEPNPTDVDAPNKNVIGDGADHVDS